MQQAITVHGPREWNEAQRRAETYLGALRGGFGERERELVARALRAAREEHQPGASSQLSSPHATQVPVSPHPVTRVMELLFDILPTQDTIAPPAMAPPIQRTSMLPEKTEFPFHDGLHRLFRAQLLSFAGVR